MLFWSRIARVNVMEKFVEITDVNAVLPFSDVVIDGVQASTNEWKKDNIYPNKGMVAQVIGNGISADGEILILQLLDDFFAVILSCGVKNISQAEFWKRLPQNLILKEDKDKRNDSAFVNSCMQSLNRMKWM